MQAVLCSNQVSNGATFFLLLIIHVTRAYLGGFGVAICIKRHLNEFNSILIEYLLLVSSPVRLGTQGETTLWSSLPSQSYKGTHSLVLTRVPGAMREEVTLDHRALVPVCWALGVHGVLCMEEG